MILWIRPFKNIRGERLKNAKKEETFTVLKRRRSFLEMGGGAKISYFRQIFTPAIKSTDFKGRYAICT